MAGPQHQAGLLLRTASEVLSTPAKAAAANATSSDTDLVTATAGSGATPSTFTFKVQQLAASHQLMANGFTDTTDLVGGQGAGRRRVSEASA